MGGEGHGGRAPLTGPYRACRSGRAARWRRSTRTCSRRDCSLWASARAQQVKEGSGSEGRQAPSRPVARSASPECPGRAHPPRSAAQTTPKPQGRRAALKVWFSHSRDMHLPLSRYASPALNQQARAALVTRLLRPASGAGAGRRRRLLWHLQSGRARREAARGRCGRRRRPGRVRPRRGACRRRWAAAICIQAASKCIQAVAMCVQAETLCISRRRATAAGRRGRECTGRARRNVWRAELGRRRPVRSYDGR